MIQEHVYGNVVNICIRSIQLHLL